MIKEKCEKLCNMSVFMVKRGRNYGSKLVQINQKG